MRIGGLLLVPMLLLAGCNEIPLAARNRGTGQRHRPAGQAAPDAVSGPSDGGICTDQGRARHTPEPPPERPEHENGGLMWSRNP